MPLQSGLPEYILLMSLLLCSWPVTLVYCRLLPLLCRRLPRSRLVHLALGLAFCLFPFLLPLPEGHMPFVELNGLRSFHNKLCQFHQMSFFDLGVLG